jgi:hypothetical protein
LDFFLKSVEVGEIPAPVVFEDIDDLAEFGFLET